MVGGTIDPTNPNKWHAPVVPVLQEGELEIEAVTDQLIEAGKASLSSNFTGSIGGDAPLDVEVTISVLNDGTNSPFSIDSSAPQRWMVV